VLDEIANGQKAVRPDEWQDLIGRDKKRDRVNDSEEAQDDESRKPVTFAVR
jgi:hypothetical protein